MKSQSQLQQQAVAAALAKKSGKHGAAGNRRLRRNVEVVVNALKNRSQSNNLQPGQEVQGAPVTQGTATNQGLNNTSGQGLPSQFANMQYYHRNQFLDASASGQHHSSSQQVLDSSQAIQHKISMYSNQVNAKKQTKNIEQSPILIKQGSSINSLKAPKQTTSGAANPQQKQNLTSQQPPAQSTQTNMNSSVQAQLQQMMRKGERNQQQNLYTNPSNLSNYYNPGAHQGKTHHQSAAQLGEPLIPRSQSQLAQGGPKAGSFVQIKGSTASQNRNATYGGTLTQRQKSSGQMNASNTLYSQISLKEIPSPGKPYKVGIKPTMQRIPAPVLYGTQRGPTSKFGPIDNEGFVQYTNQELLNQATEGYDLHQHNFTERLSSHENLVRSRNVTNLVTTNGVTHGAHASQGAILNINTASDINIYNNAFIVQTSPSHNSNTVNGRQPRVSSSSKRQVPKNGSVVTNQSSNSQRSRNPQGPVTNPSQQTRSLSTGRNQKSAHGPRPGKPLGGSSSKTNRVQAVTDAYNQNRSYLINNQPVIPLNQIAQGPLGQLITQHVNPGQNFVASWRDPSHQGNSSMSVYDYQAKQASGKGYSSTENILRSQDSSMVDISGEERKSSLTRPYFNNLISDSSLQRLNFGVETSMQIAPKRNFKNVKKSTLNTRAIQDLAAVSKKSVVMTTGLPKKIDRGADLINQGRLKIQQKDYNEAIKLFTEVLETVDAGNVEAIFYRAISFLDQGNLQQAISELWRVVDDKVAGDSGSVELRKQAYILLSIAHKRLGETQNALQDLQTCIKVFPQYADAYLARGQHLLLQEEFSLALTDFQKFIQLNSSPFSGYLGLGDCYKARKNYEEASSAYTKAIKLLPSQKDKHNYEQLYQQCYLKRGLSGYREGKHIQALGDLQNVIQKDTSNVKAHYYIGKLLAKGVENQYSQQSDAILHFEQVAKYPEQEFYFGNALFQMAKLRLRQKDYYEAFHCLKRASDNNFQSKRLAMYKDFTEGVLYLIKRKIKKGVQILSDLLEVLLNKDKDEKSGQDTEGEKKPQATIDLKKRLSNKAHTNYLIHQILLFRAYGYVAIEKYEVAQDDIKRVLKYGKVDAATTYNKWLGKGILRMDHEDYLMASKFFTKAWKKFPENKDPYCLQVISIVRSYSYSLGGYFIDQQIKYQKVLETKKFMDKAINNCCKHQKESCLFFFRGLLNFQMQNFYEALQDFNTAIESEEESSAHFFLARGRTYACLSVLTEAMKDLSVALNLDETMQQAYIYRGKCAYLIGDNNLAFLDFQRLILTDPKNPMVHVYAGNLLMTTGAYSDAVKAYENADTVQPTTVSAFQRVRCYCALTDLANAKKMMDETKSLQPDDVLLNFDSLCLDELIKVSKSTVKLSKPNLTPADIKSCDQDVTSAIQTLDELIVSYESDRLCQLNRRDALLNIQIIPNVQRVRLEKAKLAHDINAMKDQLTEEQRVELPSLSVDLEEPVNLQQIKRYDAHSYYFENIFNLEDFFLYRGVFKFYQRNYKGALADFEQAWASYRAMQNENKTRPGASGFNTRNQTLQQFSIGNAGTGEASLHSNATDLSDIGLSSFNELEFLYNSFVCHLLMSDKSHVQSKLNDLIKKIPKKYATQMPLLRMLTFEMLGDSEKVKAEMNKLKQTDAILYKAVFASKSGFTVEPFQSESRLCSKFAPVPIKRDSGPLSGTNIKVRLSFSMPFVKPPNMIPNVDEESVQTEFNLKQIDAPMPEAPWIKRCEHGITFTNHITNEGKDREKYQKFFVEKKPTANSKGPMRSTPLNADIEHAVISTSSRLLNNMVADTLSDRNKISLMEDSSPRIVNDDQVCSDQKCAENRLAELNNSRQSMEAEQEAEVVFSREEVESGESYDSEELLEKGTTDAMAIRDSGKLIKPERDSLVNMGENLTRDNLKELRRMKKEIVDPKIQIESSQPKDLLPRIEESKTTVAGRYAQLEESEELATGAALLPDSQLPSTRQKLVQGTQVGPHRLSQEMLQGSSHKVRERRVSNLSIGNLINTQTLKSNATNSSPKKQREAKNSTQNDPKSAKEKRSLFRTSLDPQDDSP